MVPTIVYLPSDQAKAAADEERERLARQKERVSTDYSKFDAIEDPEPPQQQVACEKSGSVSKRVSESQSRRRSSSLRVRRVGQ